MTFQKASASKLPFADESFDVVVSNLTFHEVKDVKDKREVVREALRVVKKGGIFVLPGPVPDEAHIWRHRRPGQDDQRAGE